MKYLTKEGFDKLSDELEKRKRDLRQKIAISIKEAKEQGDLSENAEYAEAKRQQRENESRIIFLENVVRTSKVIGKKKSNGYVDVGSNILVENNGRKMTFYIVGSNEADPSQGKISNESPIGESFFGRQKGDVVEVILPNKKKNIYKILEVN